MSRRINGNASGNNINGGTNAGAYGQAEQIKGDHDNDYIRM